MKFNLQPPPGLVAVLNRLWPKRRREDCNTPICSSDSMDDRYLVDFRPDRFGGVDIAVSSDNGGYADSVVTEEKKAAKKIAVRPKDVLGELEKKPTHFSLEGLDDKIAILEAKRDLIRQHHAATEVEGLVLCLQNRKKYDQRSKEAGVTYREYFSHFDPTDQRHIEALCQRHNLVMKEADIFVPELPADATRTMERFTKVCEELCGKKPRLYVIANSTQFRDAYGKRDPILLAQSPFGFYYYVLGAWDEEMLYLPEL